MRNTGFHPGIWSVLVIALSFCTTVSADADVNFFSSTFLPTSVTITQGEAVNFNWVAGDHTVVSGEDQDDPEAGDLFDEPLDEDNPTVRVVFDEPGVYSFHDGLDDDITGTIRVEEFEVLVAVVDSAFDPQDVTLFEGDKVVWVYECDEFHTITNGVDLDDEELGELFDFQVVAGVENEWDYVFDDPGVVPYLCIPHFGPPNNMIGTVTVQNLFIRGDADRNGVLDIADPINMLEYVYLDGESNCLDSMDTDDDGDVELDDVLLLLDALFTDDGENPAGPFPTEGPDRTDDDNRCEDYLDD